MNEFELNSALVCIGDDEVYPHERKNRLIARVAAYHGVSLPLQWWSSAEVEESAE